MDQVAEVAAIAPYARFLPDGLQGESGIAGVSARQRVALEAAKVG